MEKEILIKANAAIKQYPNSFLHAYDVLGALQAIKNEISARTDATDTLSVSVPTEMIEDLSKLEWLPFVEDKNVSIEGDRLTFDWFTMPEDKTGFGIVASEFVETVVSALAKINDYNDTLGKELLEAMEEAERISHDPSVPAYDSIEEMLAALEAEDDEE